MDVRLQKLLRDQDDLVASWQLLAVGWTPRMIEYHARRQNWRRIHRGVYTPSQGRLTRQQLWRAATLTSPDSFLSQGSAGAYYGIRRFDKPFEVVTRPGSGGRRRHGRLLVCRSATLAGHTTTNDGIPMTTAARVLVDLAAHVSERGLGRAFREALRLEVATAHQMAAILTGLDSARGTSHLKLLTARYGHLPYSRTRSNPEARALEVLHDAGVEPPLVNVRVAGEEADLVWPRRRRIVEVDGPQFHRFRDEDERKRRAWEGAGFAVERIASDDVYGRPELLVALAGAP